MVEKIRTKKTGVHCKLSLFFVAVGSACAHWQATILEGAHTKLLLLFIAVRVGTPATAACPGCARQSATLGMGAFKIVGGW